MIATLFSVAMLFLIVGASCSDTATNTNQTTTNETVSENENTNETSETNTNTGNDAVAAMKAMSGEVYTITSTDGKVTGQLGFNYEEYEGTPLLYTAVFLKIKDNYSSGGGTYPYVSHLTTEGNETSDHDGSIAPRFCRDDLVINILDSFDDFMETTQPYSDCAQELGTETAFMDPLFYTNHFTQAYSQSNYLEALEQNKYVIFDGTGINTQDEYSEYMDVDRVPEEGAIYKTYTLTYSQ